MALAYVGSASTSVGFADTVTLAYTIASGTDRLLIATISLDDNNTGVVNSVDFAGLPLKKAISIRSGTDSRQEIWYLVDPPVGTFNLITHLSGGIDHVLAGHDFTGANLDSPIGAVATQTNSGQETIITTINTAYANSILIDSVSNSNTDVLSVTEASQTERTENSSSFHRAAASTKPAATSGAYTMGWDSAGGTQNWSHAIIEIREAMNQGFQINKLRPAIFTPGIAR